MKPIKISILLCISLLTGIAQAATVTFTASGNWTAPAGVTSVTVEAWGGGGGGGAATGNPAKGGGGAGGQYVRRVVTVVPGNIYPIVVGTGGTVGAAAAGGVGGDSTFATTSVVAKGGAGGALCGTNNCVALGGLGSAVGGVGDTVFVGGNGSDGDGATGVGGAGGGGAGSTGQGGNAVGDTAGIGTPGGGGSGAAARTTGGACGNAATVAGGGGCGGYATSGTNRSGGVGAAGQVVISYAAAPIVTTNAATSLATTSVVLNGNVNDNGGATTVLFDYGTTMAVYSNTINAAQSPLAAGSGATPVSANISGLNCGTPYYFRVRAVNAAGTTLGAEQTFTTAACPTGLSVTASPAGCVNDASVGAFAWTLLDAVASDNSYATISLNDNQQSNYLKCTGYGFAIPAGATINGITVNVERSATNTPIQDFRMRVLKAGVIGATDRSTATQYPTLDTVEAHGSAADLWGTTWTAADINNVNFGAALAAFKNGTNGGARTVNVDHMPITVSYTPTTPWVASINRTSPNPTAANTSVTWDVLFSGNALGVDAADFQLVMGGAATGATITSVTGSGRVWTVTANTGSGATGTLGLNLVDNNTITIGGVPLGGAGAGNGNFTGEVYTLEVPVCSGTFIYCDDFERSSPGGVGNGWTVTPAVPANCTGVAGNSGCAGIDSDIPPFNVATNPRPNPTRAMFTRWTIVSVDSPVIDLSGHPSALLSFWMRRGGDLFSEYPEAAGEDYLVQYLANDGTWKVLAQYPTGVMQGQIFTPTIQLPPDAMHANFKLRYYQPAGSGCCGMGGAPGVIGYDYWHIDNVIIREAPESSYVGAFCDNFEAGLGRWSISAEGAPGLPPAVAIGDAGLNTTDFLSATHELDMRWGYVVASTLRTDITGVNGNITYWVKSGTTAARDPDANEDLVVEYRNSAGTWSALATYPGLAAAGATYNGSHVIPADAKHTGFRLRFRMLNGSAFDNDYWHIDDVCVGASLTNVDLAIAKAHIGAVTPGAQATYTLTVSNPGVNALAGTISVVDTLPTGLSFQSGSGTGWTCTANGQDVTCSYVGTLNGGATAPVITLVVNVDAGASGTLTNTATVSGSAPDGNLVNNTATDTVILTPGFVFTDAPCVHGLAFGAPGQTCNLFNWSPQIAGQNSADVYLTKVNTLGRPSQYVAATTVNFEFGLACHNPTTNAGVQASFSAAGSALPLCEASGAVPTNWSPGVDRTFAANTTSIGPYVFNYADVGQVELHVRNSAATSQAGSSGAFVVKPGGFVLSSIVRTSDSFANPSAADASGATFVKAGENFSVIATALTVSGKTKADSGIAIDCAVTTTDCTPNYGRETTPESVKLTPTLVAGLGLTNNPAIGGTFGTFGLDCAGGAGTSGVACGTAFTWNEVGIIRLTPSVGDGGYLTAGDVVGTVSGNVGRFYPDHFDTSISVATTMNCPAGLVCPCPPAALCPPSTTHAVYSSQPFRIWVTARSASGARTLNYSFDGIQGFSKNVGITAVDAMGGGASPEGNISASMNTIAANLFTNGQAGVSSAVSTAYEFSVIPTVPTDIFLRASDSDGATSLRIPAGTSWEQGIKVVSGRLRVSNAYGSERLPLTLQAVAQYFTANGWVNSTTDSVTSLTLAADYNVVKNGTTTGKTTPAPTGVTTLNAGVRNITLSAPAGGATGTAVVSPTAPPFLPVTAGSATFGVYNNNNNFIYRREN